MFCIISFLQFLKLLLLRAIQNRKNLLNIGAFSLWNVFLRRKVEKILIDMHNHFDTYKVIHLFGIQGTNFVRNAYLEKKKKLEPKNLL